MSWRDREYNQSKYSGGGTGSSLLAILNGSLPLGTWFGIRVRVHATLIIFIGLMIVLGHHDRYLLQDRLVSMGALFALILLHEFGHCFASIAMGGTAEKIVLSPLGGLAFPIPPHRPLAVFVTVAGGPSVNVLVCVLMAAIVYFNSGWIVSLDPFHPLTPWAVYIKPLSYYCWWFFEISY